MGARTSTVPDDRVVAIVEPVVGDVDAVAPRDRAGVLERDLDPFDRAGLGRRLRRCAPADDEGAFLIGHGG
jgi:hypothetical protein